MSKETKLTQGDYVIYQDPIRPGTWSFGIVTRIDPIKTEVKIQERHEDHDRYLDLNPGKLVIKTGDARLSRMPSRDTDVPKPI